MKFIYSAIIALLFAVTSCSEKSAYTIEGEVTNLGTSELYLHKVSNRNRQVIDTATVDVNGKFKMNGPIDSIGLYQLGADARKGVMLVLEPGASIQLKANFDDLANYTVTGHQGSEEIATFNQLINENAVSRKPLIEKFKNEVDPEKKELIINEVKELEKENYGKMVEKVKEFKHPLASLLAVSTLNPREYKPEFNLVYNRLQAEMPNSSYTKSFGKIVDQLNAEKDPLKIGDLAHDIDLPNPEGNNIKLSDLRGKYVLLDFWAAWCGPCRRENPNVVKAYNSYKDKGFVVYNVSLDKDKKKWEDAIKKDNLDWPYHVSDLKYWQSEAAKTYGVKSIPQNYLLDPEGKVVAVNLRGVALQNKLKEVFK